MLNKIQAYKQSKPVLSCIVYEQQVIKRKKISYAISPNPLPIQQKHLVEKR
jgi:hypothetical protein